MACSIVLARPKLFPTESPATREVIPPDPNTRCKLGCTLVRWPACNPMAHGGWSLLFSICTGDGAHAQHTLIWQQLTACEYARPECQGPSEPEGSALNSPRTSHTSAAAPCHAGADLAGDPLPPRHSRTAGLHTHLHVAHHVAGQVRRPASAQCLEGGCGLLQLDDWASIGKATLDDLERGMPGMPAEAARTAQSHAKQRCPH